MGNGPSAAGGDAIDAGPAVGSYEGVYLGSIPVANDSGNSVAEDAVKQISAMALPRRPIEVRLFSTCLHLVDRKTQDVLKNVSISNISFVSVDPNNSNIFSFFSHEDSSRLTTCHTVQLSSAKNTKNLLLFVNETFRMQNGEVEAPKTAKDIQRQVSMASGKKGERRRSSFANFGRELARYETSWLGEAIFPRHQPQQIRTEDALATIKMQLGTKTPAKVVVVVTESRIMILEPTGTVKLETPFNCINRYKMLNNDYYLVYLFSSPLKPGVHVSAIVMPPREPSQPSLRRTFHNAWFPFQEKLAEAEKAQASATGAAPKPGGVLVTIGAAYLGSMPVKQEKGIDVVTAAVEALRRRGSRDAAVVQIGSEGIRVSDTLTQESLEKINLADITFAVPYRDRTHDFVYCFIVKDTSLGFTACHVFEMSGEAHASMTGALQQTYHAPRETKQTMQDPFKAYGGRTPAPQDLFKRQIHRRHLTAIKPIGAGQFGQVFLANQSIPQPDGKEEIVKRAVKTLRGECTDKDRDEFVHEAEIMLKISHKNCVSMIGVAVQQRPWLMVLEFLEYGDLLGILRGTKMSGITLTEAEQLHLSFQPASGLSYMAKKGFLHLDIAARNCLVGKGSVVKVADFGLTRRLPPNSDFWRPQTAIKIPIKWCSIEVLNSQLFSEASDVWSYGVLCWEIMSQGVVPYPGILNHEVLRHLKEGTRLSKPDRGSALIYSVCCGCWQEDMKLRPTFEQIANKLRDTLKGLPVEQLKTIRDLGATLAGGSRARGGGGIDPPKAPMMSVAKPAMAKKASGSTLARKGEPQSEYRVPATKASEPQCAHQKTLYSVSPTKESAEPPVTTEGDEAAPGGKGYVDLLAGKTYDASTIPVFDSKQTPLDTLGKNKNAEPTSPPAKDAGAAPSEADLAWGEITAEDIGKPCRVKGYACEGIVRFVGMHQQENSMRCGVELADAVGNNDGTVRGHKYFDSRPGHGVLCPMPKVALVASAKSKAAPAAAAKSPAPTSTTLSEADVGKIVRVDGYDCDGVLRFFGQADLPSGEKTDVVCGVELELPLGRNDGMVRGVRYFTCADSHGVVCSPDKVRLVQDPSRAVGAAPVAEQVTVGDDVLGLLDDANAGGMIAAEDDDEDDAAAGAATEEAEGDGAKKSWVVFEGDEADLDVDDSDVTSPTAMRRFDSDMDAATSPDERERKSSKSSRKSEDDGEGGFGFVDEDRKAAIEREIQEKMQKEMSSMPASMRLAFKAQREQAKQIQFEQQAKAGGDEFGFH